MRLPCTFIRVLLVALFLSGNVQAGQECAPLDEARAEWMSGTIALWKSVSAASLRLEERELPLIVFFDGHCAWYAGDVESLAEQADVLSGASATSLATASGRVEVRALRHGGSISLPEGGQIPPRLILFASTFGEQRSPYHVMPLPSVWRSEPHHADDAKEALNTLIRSVFVHEMAHTQQSAALGARIDAIVEARNLGDDLDDDHVQDLFEGNAGFSAMIERERELLYASAAASDMAKARRLAAEALNSMRKRHARYFAGDDEWLVELEDTFLYLEGVGNWAAWRALLAQDVPEAEALPRIRRGGRYWSQDIGLAMFLVIDRLLPGWQDIAFGDEPGTVMSLLERAVAPGNAADSRHSSPASPSTSSAETSS